MLPLLRFAGVLPLLLTGIAAVSWQIPCSFPSVPPPANVTAVAVGFASVRGDAPQFTEDTSGTRAARNVSLESGKYGQKSCTASGRVDHYRYGGMASPMPRVSIVHNASTKRQNVGNGFENIGSHCLT